MRGGRVLKDHPQTAAVVLHSMQLSRYQVIHLQYTFVAEFCHQLIHESISFARFSAEGSAYTRDSLYASIYGNYFV